MDSKTSHTRSADLFAEAEALFDSKQLAEAEVKFERLSADGPHAPEARFRLGEISLHQGQLVTAIERFRHALAIRPDWPDARCKLGIALLEYEKFDEAVANLRQALKIEPKHQDARTALAGFCKSRALWREAARHYAELIPERPNDPEVFGEFGLCCQELGDCALAEKALVKALQLGPDSPELLFNLGYARIRLGRIDDAIRCIQNALTQYPLIPTANFMLGQAYRQKGNLEAAEATLRRELEINGTFVDAMIHLGVVLQGMHRVGEAIQCYKRAIELNPFHPVSRRNYAIVALLAADFLERRNKDDRSWNSRFNSTLSFEQPRWDGTDLEGRTILLHCGEDIADTLALIRYASEVANRNGRVVVRCPPILRRLVATVSGVADVVKTKQALPEFDVHAELSSLPSIFGSTLDCDQSDWVSHLKPTASVGPDLGPNQPDALRVGLAWAESPRNAILSDRPFDVVAWAPVLRVEGCEFVCLQSVNVPKASSHIRTTAKIRGFPIAYPDFADAAAVIRQLDLVISVDCPFAHLGGAIGHLTWVLLPYAANWKWLLRRAEESWYPSITVFREPQPGHQQSLISGIARHLSDYVARFKTMNR